MCCILLCGPPDIVPQPISMKPKRGTREKPLCGFCHGLGHYRSSCPVLAQKALSAAAKKAGVEKVQEHVEAGKALTFNLPMKSQRTLKRASGKRFVKTPKKPDSSSKTKRKRNAMKNHKQKEKFRRPKAMKARGKTFRPKDVKDALKALRKTGWIHKAKHCSCGGNLVACPLTKSLKRGNGRAYLRCSECRSWYDVVAFSPLPTLKMPLPTLYECMQRYFHGPYAESVESCASFLGLSGSKTSALFKQWRALRTAECRCIAAKQKDRTLAGRPKNWNMVCL